MSKSTPISFLLGAGFSKPAGLPLASEINDRFIRFEEGDITISSDGTARFHHGKPNPNDGITRVRDRLFAEQLLCYYRDKVVGPESFQYEVFYDCYQDLLSGPTTDTQLQGIAADLGGVLGDLLWNFDSTFNQLLAQLLGKRFPEVHLGQDLPQSHATFMELVGRLGRLAPPAQASGRTPSSGFFASSLQSFTPPCWVRRSVTNVARQRVENGRSLTLRPFSWRLRPNRPLRTAWL